MWLFFALAAYVLFAAATVTDKYLLARPIPDARVYAFYTGVLGVFLFVLAPFGLEYPSHAIVFLGIFAGILFSTALLLFFYALRIGEVSRMGISLGGLIPLFTLFFIYLWTRELPSALQFAAFGVLVAGSFIVIFERLSHPIHNLQKISLIFSSSVLFGLYFALIKFLFEAQSFISVIVWTKVGAVLFAVALLFSPTVRKMIFEHKKSLPKKIRTIFVAKSVAGGVGALLQHAAVSTARIGEVSLVGALQGVQFALVFFIAVFLTRKFPGIVKEKIDKEAILVKSLGTGLIVAGIIILAVA